MARQSTKAKKTDAIEFEFEGDNGNVFSGRIYPLSNSTDNADIFPLSIVVNGLAIKGSRLIDGMKGAFIAFPSYKNNKGDYQAQCFFFKRDDMKDCEDCAKHLVELIKESK